jgi:hypothetical protein
MDRADRHKTEDLLRTLLVNLIKAGFVADSPVASRWREEGSRAQRELQASSGGEDIHLDTLWTRAIDEAQRDEFVRANESVKPRLQTTCLFALDELTRPDFDFDAGAERIRLSTATG